MKKFLSVALVLAMLLSVISVLPLVVASAVADSEMAVIEGDATRLSGIKKEYEFGEQINVTAIGSERDWVGLFTSTGESNYNDLWYYVDTAMGGPGSEVAKDITDGKALSMAPGEYIVRLMPDDETDLTKAVSWAKITVKEPEMSSEVSITGDSTRLKGLKSVYYYGETIDVTPIGSGKDWIGLYQIGGKFSYDERWFYIDTASGGAGSDVQVDLTKGMAVPVGYYLVRLMPNDTSDHSLAVATAIIEVRAYDPISPSNATYTLKSNSDGFAWGTVSVTLPNYDSSKPQDIIMLWADDNGKLEGYSPLACFKATGETTTHEFGKNIMIPAKATKLLIYGYSSESGMYSDEYATVELPEGSSWTHGGELVMEFQIVSDIHVTTNPQHTHNLQVENMLRDITENSPNSKGIVVVGDLADSGNKAELDLLEEIYEKVENAPHLYRVIGNHDLYNHATLESGNSQFLELATLPDGTHPDDTFYDFYIDGYHFVVVGTDDTSGWAYLDDYSLQWLDAALSDSKDSGKPTFLLMHQPLPDTVAGSYSEQGWGHVKNADKVKDILAKYPSTILFSGHSHWTLDSLNTMFSPTSELPINAFNTASVAYLWTSYNVASGEHLDGSQGYYIRVYDNRVEVLGRDFLTGEWISSAQFCVVTGELDADGDDNNDAPAADEPPTNEPQATSSATDTPQASDTAPIEERGCGSAIGAASTVIVTTTLIALGSAIAFKRREFDD